MIPLYHTSYDPYNEDVRIENGEIVRMVLPMNHMSPSVVMYHDKDFYAACGDDNNWYEISHAQYVKIQQRNNEETYKELMVEEEILPAMYGGSPPVTYVQPDMIPSYTNFAVGYSYNPVHLTQQNVAILPVQPIDKGVNSEEGNEKFVGIDGNFQISIQAQYNYVDDEQTYVKYLFYVRSPGFNQTVLIDADDACNPKWVSRKTGSKAFLNPGKKPVDGFIKYISNLMATPDLPTLWIYRDSGWKYINEKPVFVYADGAIGATNLCVKGAENCKICYIPEAVGSRDIFTKTLTLLEVTRNPEITAGIFGFLHAGVLTSLFDEAQYPIKTILAIVGLTNSKKTSLALATLRLYNTNTTSPDITFSSTPGGIEIAMAQYGDAVLIVDDCMPATHKARQNGIDAKLDDIVRAIGDRTPKRRMFDFANNNNQKGSTYVAKGCVAITGEQLHGVQSALARMVTLSISNTDVISEKLSFFQKNYQIIPTHLVDFIAYISEQYENVVEKIRQNFPTYRNNIKVRIARFADAYATLMLAVDITCDYAHARCFLKDEELANLRNHLLLYIRQIIRKNDNALIHQDPGVVILEALDEAISTHVVTLIKRANYTCRADVVLEDEDFFYARAESLMIFAKHYCQKYDVPIALCDKKAVINELERLGVLEFTKERARKLPNNSFDSRRYLYIKRSKMAAILEELNAEV